MVERSVDTPGRAHRERTDESLRAERERADAVAAEKQLEVEAQADTVVQVARERADEVVQAARDDADHAQVSSDPADDAFEQERDQADRVLARERAKADELLETERVRRRRYLEIFLANEREATDANLTGERANTDVAVAQRDDFLAAVSHDLRSLLGSLALSSALLVEHAPPGAAGDQTRKLAGTSQRVVLRMTRLVSDLLDVTSIEAGRVALLIEENDVADVLRDTLEAFEPLAAAKGVALTASLKSPCVGRFDAGRILQVLANLVSNSLKFTPAGGRISIQFVSDESELQFSVSDTGLGIPSDAVSTVFDKFKQVARDRRGLGLGLHISKGIVEAHGGRLWVQSQLGDGSTFHFAIPRSFATR